jgi:TatD DNase family protein
MLVDSHCHLDVAQFDEDRDAVLARARTAGVGLIVNPGIDLQHCRQAIALAQAHPQIYAAVGIHPNSSDTWFADPETAIETRTESTIPEASSTAATSTEAALVELAGSSAARTANKVVAYGEIGLDYYWDKVPKATQQRAFEAQLDLAARLGLPVIIHNRDANADTAAILASWINGASFRTSPLAQREYVGVLHAYGGDLAMAQTAYEWGFILSLGGPVTFKNARRLHALTPQLRADRLMLETDAPYLTPHPYRGKRNEPAYVALVCAQLAELFGTTVEEMAATTTATALAFFGLQAEDLTPVPELMNTNP